MVRRLQQLEYRKWLLHSCSWRYSLMLQIRSPTGCTMLHLPNSCRWKSSPSGANQPTRLGSSGAIFHILNDYAWRILELSNWGKVRLCPLLMVQPRLPTITIPVRGDFHHENRSRVVTKQLWMWAKAAAVWRRRRNPWKSHIDGGLVMAKNRWTKLGELSS